MAAIVAVAACVAVTLSEYTDRRRGVVYFVAAIACWLLIGGLIMVDTGSRETSFGIGIIADLFVGRPA